MSAKCFNTGIRFRSYSDYRRLQYYKQEITKHYMDLQFCTMCNLRRAPKYRKVYTPQQWAKTIGACNKIRYDFLSCRYFLLPWANGKKYMLYFLDYKEKKLMVIDPDGIEEKWKHMPYKKYVCVIIHFCQRYMLAMNIHRPGWNQDIFDWPWTRAEGIAEDKVGYSSGYLVLQHMTAMNSSSQSTTIHTDSMTMRQNFVIDVLAHEENNYHQLLPQDMKTYLSQITGKNILDCPVSLRIILIPGCYYELSFL